MQHSIFETDFFKKIEKDPKAITIPYMKSYGPIITDENINKLLEELMIDYFVKKDLIQQHYKEYKPLRSDYYQMNFFEKELRSRIGKQQLKMDFLNIDPTHNIKEQFEKIINDNNFEYFLI